jgi:hypothetical protein
MKLEPLGAVTVAIAAAPVLAHGGAEYAPKNR